MIHVGRHACWRRNLRKDFNILLVIPPEHKAIDSDLENWAAWCRRRATQGVCGSVESRWHSPQIWNPPEAKVTVFGLDAGRIEDALRAAPEDARRLLKGWYVQRTVPERICRWLGIPADPYMLGVRLYGARDFVRIHLTTPAELSKKQTRQSESSATS